MKKITLLFMALLLGVGGVSATEYELDLGSLSGETYNQTTHQFTFGTEWKENQWWVATWDGEKNINTSYADYGEFVLEYTASASKKFRVYFAQVNGTTTQTVQPTANTSFGRTIIKLNSATKAGIAKIIVSDAGTAFNMTLTRAYFRSKSNESSTNLWTGSQPLGDWANSVTALTNDGAGKTALKSAKVGDVIKVTFTNTASENNINVRNSSWNDFIDGTFSGFAEQAAEQSAEYVIPNAEVLGSIQLNGIIVSGKNATITNIDLLTYDESYDACMVTIGTDKIATFSTGSKKLDFSGTGITPYYASAVGSGQVTLTAVADNTTWGYQGYILKGAAGTYEIPTTESATYQNTNYLNATGDYNREVYRSHYSDYTGEDKDGKIKNYYRYIFAKKGDETPGFYKLGTEYSRTKDATTVYYHELGAHKAYLETPTDITPAGARVALVFSDEAETTGISASLGEKAEKTSEHIYNLRGMRVTQPQKGLYIKNGKKMIIR